MPERIEELKNCVQPTEYRKLILTESWPAEE